MMIISDNSDTTIWNNTLLESSITLQEASFVLLEVAKPTVATIVKL